jgi:hypothetical protein
MIWEMPMPRARRCHSAHRSWRGRHGLCKSSRGAMQARMVRVSSAIEPGARGPGGPQPDH